MSNLVHIHAWCDDCGAEWGKRNAHGLAVQHSRRYGHAVGIEAGYAYYYVNGVRE